LGGVLSGLFVIIHMLIIALLRSGVAVFYTSGRKKAIQALSVVCSNNPIPVVE